MVEALKINSIYLVNRTLSVIIARMIKRYAQDEIIQLLTEFSAVGILGPRQIGKTTLALEVAGHLASEAIYLDLESPSELSKLDEPEQFFELNTGKLIILDEIQRAPELFSILRGAIDRNRRKGHSTGQFLILGSASLDLIRQSSESLAGRIAYIELSGLNVIEINKGSKITSDQLWLRGGFPDSVLAKNDSVSMRWRANFISTYLERDIPQLGPRIPATTLRRLWTMLAHSQSTQVNIAKLGANLDVAAPTAKRYIDLLEDLLLIRSLRPWFGNIGKRLVKTPKVYIRDSGLTHALLNISNLNDLMGHPVVGTSWEGFVIENLISCASVGATFWYYRTSAGAEIDLIIEYSSRKKIAIEIKRSISPKVSKGFYLGCDDIGATDRFVVYAGDDQYPLAKNITAISLTKMMHVLEN